MFNLNENIGKRVAALRKSRHMTQEVLAEKLNCSIKHISHVERGVASLSLELLIETSELFGCTLDYLVLGKQAPAVSQIPSYMLEILADEDERRAQEKDLLRSYLEAFQEIRTYYSNEQA